MGTETTRGFLREKTDARRATEHGHPEQSEEEMSSNQVLSKRKEMLN